MTITNRDELNKVFEEWFWADTHYPSGEAIFDWFSEQGFALMPKEPTEDTIIAMKEANTSWAVDSTVDPEHSLLNLARRLQGALIDSGDLLKRRE